MCVAIPGKVILVKDKIAVVDFSGNRVNAMAGLLPVKEGDYALVHAGCIIQIMQQDEAEELTQLFEEIEDGETTKNH